MAKVAFLGLGVMGFPMAGHLVKAGHDVTVYNRTASKAADWAGKHKGKTAPTPADAAKGAEFVDAPVSGGQAGAENGQLGIMCGGDAATFAKAEPVIKIYAKALTLIGP